MAKALRFMPGPVSGQHGIAVIASRSGTRGCGIRADAACQTESTARPATKARRECVTHHHALRIPCLANSPEHPRMEKFLATIGRRWTFMEHMKLPAYWDRLLEARALESLEIFAADLLDTLAIRVRLRNQRLLLGELHRPVQARREESLVLFALLDRLARNTSFAFAPASAEQSAHQRKEKSTCSRLIHFDSSSYALHEISPSSWRSKSRHPSDALRSPGPYLFLHHLKLNRRGNELLGQMLRTGGRGRKRRVSVVIARPGRVLSRSVHSVEAHQRRLPHP
jgi:hypothetical protein